MLALDVMGGLVPAVHVFLSAGQQSKTWMLGTRPGITAESCCGLQNTQAGPQLVPEDRPMDAKTSRYHDIYARWQRDPQGFWAEAAADIDWIEKPKTVFDAKAGVYGRWFPD